MDRTTEYANLVCSGARIAGKTEYLCCKRHLDDLKNKDFPYIFDVKEAEKHIDIANELTILEGESEQKLKTRGFQNFILGSLFGWRKKRTKERRFREAYIQMARQNGKSFVCGVLCNDFATFSGYKRGRILIGATKQEQANIVWGEVQKFIEADEELQELYKIREYRHSIVSLVTGTEIKAIGRDTKTADGFRSILAVTDEYHAHPNSQMLKLLTDGQIKVSNALSVTISTSGFDLGGPCYDLYKFCKNLIQGNVKKESQFVYIAELDLPETRIGNEEEYEAEISNPMNWCKANPLYLWLDDTTVDEEMLARLAEKYISAKAMGGSELVNFLTKSLDVWVTAGENAYIPADSWKQCASNMTINDCKGKRCYIGIDLSSGGDLTTVTFLILLDDGKVFIHSHSFLPQLRLAEHEATDRAPYRQWVNTKLITLTNGDGTYGIKTDYEFVANYIKTTIETYELEVVGVGYDPWNASAFLPKVEEATSCDLTEVLQTVNSLNEATEDFRLAVEAGAVLYDEKNELLNWSVLNAKLIIRPDGKMKVDKTSEKRRIDCVDSVIDSWVLFFRDSGDDITNEDLYNAWREAVKGKKNEIDKED